MEEGNDFEIFTQRDKSECRLGKILEEDSDESRFLSTVQRDLLI